MSEMPVEPVTHPNQVPRPFPQNLCPQHVCGCVPTTTGSQRGPPPPAPRVGEERGPRAWGPTHNPACVASVGSM